MKYQFLPPFDAWKITVTGIFVVRPGGRSGRERRTPPVTAMVVIVDDEKGVAHFASGE
jgi:hypothetical protein